MLKSAQSTISSPPSLIQNINQINKRLETSISNNENTEYIEYLEYENKMLKAKIQRLEEELEVEQKLKYHWADRNLFEDRT